MKRVVLVAAVIALALVGVGIAALLRDDDGGKTVATVSGHKIKSEDVDLAVEHFHEEADRSRARSRRRRAVRCTPSSSNVNPTGFSLRN